jgi:hypothetical protein
VYSRSALTDRGVEPDVETGPDHFTSFRLLPPQKRLKTGLIAGLVAWHVAVTLLWGAGDKMREHIKPALSWYAGGLKLGGTWGMFAAPGRMHVIFVYGVTAKNERTLLSPNPNASFYQDMVDMRERKMRSRLGEKEQRDYWGILYLESFCKRSDGDWFHRIELEMAEHNEEHRWGKREVILTRTCLFARKAAKP